MVTVPGSNTTVTVKLGAGCSEETLQDPNLCKPCTQVADCTNPCEPCEYCLGKTELPPECFPPEPDGGAGGSGGGDAGTGGGGPTNNCKPGQQPCDPNTPCPAGYFCLTGCCIQAPA